jgi:hypothetical protein
VTAVRDGFMFHGKRFRSLSKIARRLARGPRIAHGCPSGALADLGAEARNSHLPGKARMGKLLKLYS